MRAAVSEAHDYERFAKVIVANGGKLDSGGGLTNTERALMNIITIADKVAA